MVKEVSTLNRPYRMHGQMLGDVISEKDLGVVFSKNLKVRQQCEEACKRASQILGLIHRTHSVYKSISSGYIVQVNGATTP